MAKKIPFRYRVYCFALIMSFFTSMIVSATVIGLSIGFNTKFMQIWPSSFAIAWPIVFIAILIIAPLVNKLLNVFIEPA
jgi:type III secretory pathway component EscS